MADNARQRDWESQHEALEEIAPDPSGPPLQEQLLEDFIHLPLSFPEPVVWTTEEGRLEAVGEIRTRFHVRFSEPADEVDERKRALLESLEPEEQGRGVPVFALRLADADGRLWKVELRAFSSMFLLADDPAFETHYFIHSPPEWQQAFEDFGVLFGAGTFLDSRESTVYEIDGDEIEVLYKYQEACLDFAILEDPGPPCLLVRVFGIHEWDTGDEVPAFVISVGFDWLFSQTSWDGLPLKCEVQRVSGRAKAQKNVVLRV